MKFRKLHLKIVLVGIALALISGCEKPTLPESGFAAKAILSEDIIHIGDVISLTITARHAPNSTVTFPDIADGKQIIVRGSATETSTPAEGVVETKEIIRLTSLRTGNWMITTNPVVCTFADGSQKAQKLPLLKLTVESTLTENNADQLCDIKGPVHDFKKALLIVILIIVIAVIAAIIALRFSKRSKVFKEKPAPQVPPHIMASNSLALLKNKKWVPEPFFVELSLILRTYIEGRYKLNAPELTTEELTQKLPYENKKLLGKFFEQSDLVKFARADAQLEVMRTAFSSIESFVDKTKQEETE